MVMMMMYASGSVLGNVGYRLHYYNNIIRLRLSKEAADAAVVSSSAQHANHLINARS